MNRTIRFNNRDYKDNPELVKELFTDIKFKEILAGESLIAYWEPQN